MASYKHKKTGRWVAQVFDSHTKKKRQVGTFATKREAAAAVRRELDRKHTSDMTVSAWRDRWLTTPDIRESTRISYEQQTRAFADQHGGRRMEDVTRTIARDWVRTHPASHSSLSAMFGAAIYEDVIVANPFSMLVKRTVAKRDLQPDWLTESDISTLERAAYEHHGPVYGPSFAAMIRFAAETGLRPGEMFVVKDTDLDPDSGVMYVRQTAASRSKRIELPKNSQQREVVLSIRAAQAAASTFRPADTDRVFSTPRGRQFWLGTLSNAWRPVRDLAGRPGMHFYELRHYCATRLLELGLDDRDVAIQLGHTDGGALVRTVYGHPSDRQARERIQRAVDGDDKERRVA